MAIKRLVGPNLLKGLGLMSLFFVATEASAHARWKLDGLLVPRIDADNVKDGNNRKFKAPCGDPKRSNAPIELTAGAEIEAEWQATIYHRGYFRIRFSMADDKDWEDVILLDNVREVRNQEFYKATITLPDVECDTCTLQLVQVMEDRNPPTNYYSCSDIVLKKAKVEDTTPPADVSNFSANASKGAVSLSWTNPAEDFAGALIVQADNSVSATPSSGTEYQVGDSLGNAEVIAVGNAMSANVNGLAAGETYHFKAFAYDAAFNYSSGVSESADVPAEVTNKAPVVTLRHEQLMGGDDIVYQDKGNVLVQAMVSDENAGDQHTLDWSKTDSALVDVDNSDINFTFDPSNVAAGNYTVTVEVTDNGTPAQTTSKSLTLTIEEPQAENQAPTVSVKTQQMGRNRLTAYQDEGKMTIFAEVSDANGADNHTYEWTVSSNAISDIDARDNYFIFNAADVPVGTYTVKVKITDNGSPAKSVEQEIQIKVEERKKAGSIQFLWLAMIAALMMFRRRR